MALEDEIAQLLSLPEDGAEAPSLAVLETTLTDGYAQALALEGERWRTERRLGEIAREARNGDRARELASLSQRLESADGELAKLRLLLRSLHARASARRAAMFA